MDEKKPKRKSVVFGLAKGEEKLTTSLVSYKSTALKKSIVNILNGEEGSVERLAFDTDPTQHTTLAGVYQPKTKGVPDDILKRIAVQDSLVSNIVRARQNHVSVFGRPRPDRFSTGFVIEPNTGVLDTLSKEEKAELDVQIERAAFMLKNCGNTSGMEDEDKITLVECMMLLTRNAIVNGRIALEIIYTGEGDSKKFHHFAPIDASTIYKAAEKNQSAQQGIRDQAWATLQSITGKKLKKERFDNNDYKWIQVFAGRPLGAFTGDEVKCYNFYPVPDIEWNGYPVTPIDTVITSITTHINIVNHNRLYFQSGRATRGMLVISSDDDNPQVIHNIKQQFNACVDGSALIITKENGELSIDKTLGEATERKVTIWTGRDWQSASIYKTGERDLVNTTLANGVVVPTSPDHKFLVVGPTGPTWKEQKDLCIGDYLCLNNTNISDDNLDQIPKFKGRGVTPEIMEVLGWLTGDGNMALKGDYERNVDSFRMFYHHEKEPDILDRHFKILTDFGVKAKKYRRDIGEDEAQDISTRYGFNKVASHRIGIDSYDSEFVRWMVSIGFNSSKNGKTIPPTFYKLPTSLKTAFLRGFFSADGNNAGRKDPVIWIARDSLRAQTKSLLLSLGIRTAPTEGMSSGRFGIEKKHASLKVKDRKKFFELIGFIQPHKQPNADFSTSTHSRSDRIPQKTAQNLARQIREFDDVSKKLDKKHRQKVNDIVCGMVHPTRKRLTDLMSVAGFAVPQWLSQYNFEPIVALESTGKRVMMFDATVDDTEHTFSVNGVVTHNSINNVNNSWRMPVFGCGTGETITWQPIDSGGQKDAEFQYLTDMNAREILTAFMMSPDELPGWSYLSRGTSNQALSESNNEYKLNAARDVGIRPLLQGLEDFFNSNVMPLIDFDLSKKVRLRFMGLDADNAEKEAVRLQQDSSIWETYDGLMRRVEKKPIGKAWGGELPFNQVIKSYIDQYFTVGEILEHFCGIEGASKDPALAYRRDPMFFQWAQMQQAQQQQQQMQQAQAQQQAQQQGQGGDAQPTQDDQKQPTEKQKDAQVENSSASGGASGGGGDELARSIDMALDSLTKSEKDLPPNKRRILTQHKKTIDFFMNGWEEDAKQAVSEVMKVAKHHIKK